MTDNDKSNVIPFAEHAITRAAFPLAIFLGVATAAWLFKTPWWVPAGWAWALTIFVLWASWPADKTNSR